MPWLKTDSTHNHAQLGLLDNGRGIQGLVVCNKWDLEPLGLQISLALGGYQPSAEVRFVLTAVLRHNWESPDF